MGSQKPIGYPATTLLLNIVGALVYGGVHHPVNCRGCLPCTFGIEGNVSIRRDRGAEASSLTLAEAGLPRLR